jgi:hypothetical protein
LKQHGGVVVSGRRMHQRAFGSDLRIHLEKQEIPDHAPSSWALMGFSYPLFHSG